MPRPRRDGAPSSGPEKVKLSELLIRNLQPREDVYQIYDLQQRGLSIQIQPTGRKAWKCIYSVGGRRRWYSIGSVDAIGLADARKLAREVLYKVDQGADPCAERKAARGSNTFEEVAKRYVDEYAMADARADATISEKLVKAYILFQHLRHDPLMAKLHQEEGLDLPDYGAALPEFTNFVKLTCRLGLQRTAEDKARYAAANEGTRKNKQSGYVATLQRLHVEFEENAIRYEHNMEAQLLAYHQEHNGIEGAREWRAKRGAKEPIATGSPVRVQQRDSVTIITRAARMVLGGSLRDVQLLAGHRSIAVTQGYMDGDSDAQRRLVSLI